MVITINQFQPLNQLIQVPLSEQDWVGIKNSPTLFFMKNSSVLHTLRDVVLDGGNVDIYYNDEIVRIDSSTNSTASTVITKSGKILDCDLLVGADGSLSNVYNLVQEKQGKGEKGEKGEVDSNRIDRGESRLKYRGYDVYRGFVSSKASQDEDEEGEGEHASASASTSPSRYQQPKKGKKENKKKKKTANTNTNNNGFPYSPLDQLRTQDSFQTWGPGSRFAMVPINASHDTWAFFAAVTGTPPPVGDINATTGTTTGTECAPLPLPLPLPFRNFSRPCTPFEVSTLAARFCGMQSQHSQNSKGLKEDLSDRAWHEPIPAVLQQVLKQHRHKEEGQAEMHSSSSSRHHEVTVCPAMASKVVEKDLIGIKTLISISSGADLEGAVDMNDVNDVKDVIVRVSVAYVGDAFHTFDPILAVGAGAAVEQGAALAAAIARNSNNINSGISGNSESGVGTKRGEEEFKGEDFLVEGGVGVDGVDIEKALKEYSAEVCTRAQRLGVISDAAQTCGHVESPLWGAYRDAVLGIMPEGPKGKAMDAMIRIVAGCDSEQKKEVEVELK